ncbi:MAG: cytoplasmic protein [Verrucomicrobia bacterium]|nr:cytoplasmic protein [Verrucomicrobiota bacterium]
MFVSEPIKPVVATGDAGAMASGRPSLPREFVWRGEPLVVADVIRTWRETSPCKHGSGEVYARKHWFEVQTAEKQIAKLYFERQSRGQNRTKRWWLFSLEAVAGSSIPQP